MLSKRNKYKIYLFSTLLITNNMNPLTETPNQHKKWNGFFLLFKTEISGTKSHKTPEYFNGFIELLFKVKIKQISKGNVTSVAKVIDSVVKIISHYMYNVGSITHWLSYYNRPIPHYVKKT